MATRGRKSSADNWTFPKISIHKLYEVQDKHFHFSPSSDIGDFEHTITLSSVDKFRSFNLLIRNLLNGFTNNTHRYLHMNLVQVAIKPLVRNGLDDAPVTVCLRDARLLNFEQSLLAVVEANLSQGPFYFNCFPGYPVSLHDARNSEPLSLSVTTTGISVALTVRIVCKAMVDCFAAKYLKVSMSVMSRMTNYFYATSGTRYTTHWDEVVHDNGLTENLDDRSMVNSGSTAVVMSSFRFCSGSKLYYFHNETEMLGLNFL